MAKEGGTSRLGAGDMFLKLEGITGESQDADHKDEIDVLDWSWGASQFGASHQGGGSGAGKVTVHDIEIEKHEDFASPTLFLKCCTGTHISKATLVVRKAGGRALDYMKFILEDVLITKIEKSFSGGDNLAREQITLNFSRFSYTYTMQAKTGGTAKKNEIRFDIKANEAI
jgi:type VI secretion system secreted protein Hcp